jgi:hypothetical protein
MKFRAAFSILATTAGIWAASGPACEPQKDAFAPEGVADQITQVTPVSSTRAAGDTMTFVALVSDEGMLRRNVQTVWVYEDVNGNVLSRDTVMTDNEGRSKVKYTIGTTPGDYEVWMKVTENMSLTATWTVRVEQPAPPTVAKVVLSHDTLRVQVETSSRLTGQVFDASNNPLTATLNWQSMNANVASVAADGTVTGRATGTTRVIANSGAHADTAVVIVEPPVGSVVVTPDTLRLNIDASSKLNVVTRDRFGGAVVAPVTWASLNTATATVGTDGTVTGKAAGTTQVTATSYGVADTTVVIVNAAQPTNTVNLSGQNRMMIRRLANGGTESHTGNMYVGDHEVNGDKSMQGFVMYDISSIPASATIASATLSVLASATSFTGDPFLLGPLYIERATPGPSLNEGTPNGVIAMTAVQAFVSVDVKTLIQAARSAGETVIWFRFRMRDLGNNNGAADYGEIMTGGLEIKY